MNANDPQTTEETKTITVEDAAKILGISRGLAYEAVRRGEIASIRIGNRILIPRCGLDHMLGRSVERPELAGQ